MSDLRKRLRAAEDTREIAVRLVASAVAVAEPAWEGLRSLAEGTIRGDAWDQNDARTVLAQCNEQIAALRSISAELNQLKARIASQRT